MENKTLNIALLQLLPGKSQEEQLNIGKTACIKAKEMGADIALFPEMWSDGYYLPQIPSFSLIVTESKSCTIPRSISAPSMLKKSSLRAGIFM